MRGIVKAAAVSAITAGLLSFSTATALAGGFEIDRKSQHHCRGPVRCRPARDHLQPARPSRRAAAAGGGHLQLHQQRGRRHRPLTPRLELPLCREGGRLPPGLWEKAAAPVLTLIPHTLGCASRLRPTTRSPPPGLPLCFFLCHRVTGSRPPDPCATRTTPASSTRRP